MSRTPKVEESVLLECAFRVYLKSGSLKATTIQNIENEFKKTLKVKKTRGAIFYLYKDKESLFRAMIDHFVLNKQSLTNKISKQTNTLVDFIVEYCKGVGENMAKMKELLYDVENPHKQYLSLVLQAQHNYPGFDEKIRAVFREEVLIWTDVIEKAKKSGEVRADVNSKDAADFFRFIFVGLSYDTAFFTGLDPVLLENKLMTYYYQIRASKI